VNPSRSNTLSKGKEKITFKISSTIGGEVKEKFLSFDTEWGIPSRKNSLLDRSQE